jgi:hypothetical protein
MRNRAEKALTAAGINTEKNRAIAKLIDYAAQNPGLEFGNYGEVKAYRAELRSITADWRRVCIALEECAALGVTDKIVIEAAKRAYSGRLEWKIDKWHYCTGQYWPTEYRAAVASVLETAAHTMRQVRPKQERNIETISDLKALNRENGGCWFEPSTMRFFNSRIESGIIKGQYFITSEKHDEEARRFTVRSFDGQGDIDTVGEFQAYRSKDEARKAIKVLQ